jgi:hypothetical protein
MVKEYKETHQQGIVEFNIPIIPVTEEVDFGIQIAKDGRVWVCVNGHSAIRFKPTKKTKGR